MVYAYNGILLNKKEKQINTNYNMDQVQNYTEWKKLDLYTTPKTGTVISNSRKQKLKYSLGKYSGVCMGMEYGGWKRQKESVTRDPK